MTTSSHVFDARGLLCPLPVLRARKVLDGLPAGTLLRIEATDPGSVRDFAAFCRETGHRLLSSTNEEGIFVFELQRRP